jgi:signal transduction histidine kinase
MRRRDIPAVRGRWLAPRLTNVVFFGGLADVALLTLGIPEAPARFRFALLVGQVLWCVWAAYRLAAACVRRERRRQARVVTDARLEGVTLATRTVRHQLGNKLAVAVAYSEMLADDPRLPDDLEEQAHKIMSSAIAAVEAVDKLQERILRVQLDTSVAGPPLLDVDASIAVDPPAKR